MCRKSSIGAICYLTPVLSVPTQQANTETFLTVAQTHSVCCGSTRIKSCQTTEVSSHAIQQMYSGCSFSSLALIDQ